MSKGRKGKGSKKHAKLRPDKAPDNPDEEKLPVEPEPESAHVAESRKVPEKEPNVASTAPALSFFEKPDWLAFAAASLVTFLVYFFTLAPNVTLEDAGELATASMYAGVPHAPGYPLWTVYSWLFTVLLPVGTIAWRVMVSSAVAAALTCGLVALMASRGGRLMLANMDWSAELEAKWQRAISAVAGFAGGAIFGFTGFMWSQAVIVEVYTLSTLTFAGVFACLMRWWYVPEKRWPLYFAYFLFGLCLANHQTLLLAAVGLELLIFLRQREVGRDFFLCNSFIYLAGLIYMASGGAMETSQEVLQATRVGSAGKILLFSVYNLVGIGSVLLTIWHTFPPAEGQPRWRGAGFMGSAFVLAFTLLAFVWVVSMSRVELKFFLNPELFNTVAASGKFVWNLDVALNLAFSTTERILFLFCILVTIGAVAALVWMAVRSDNSSTRAMLAGGYLLVFLVMGLMWSNKLISARHQVPSAAQLATTKTMALQAQANPNFARDTTALIQKQAEEFLNKAGKQVATANSLSYWFVLLNIPFLGGVLVHSWKRSGGRGAIFSEWRLLAGTRLAALAGVSCYLFMPLTSLTNPPMNWAYPRTADNLKYAIVRGQYDNPSKEAADSFSKFLWDWDENRIPDGGQIGVFIDETIQEFNPAFLLLALLPFVFLRRMRSLEWRWLAGMGIVFTSMTVLMIAFRNISGGESARHLNKVFFEAPHMFIGLGLGLGLALALGAVATQWDRWRPILLKSACALLALEILWWPPTQTAISATPASLLFAFTQYDAAILQAAAVVGVVLFGMALALIATRHRALTVFLAICALLPLRHGLANWWDNELRGHQFGYWYGHDMFEPPFESADGKPLYPPMEPGAVLYGGTDAGRFNPTYFIFCESQADPAYRTDPDFDRRDVYIITQNAAVEGQYMQYIRAHYCRSRQADAPLIYSALVPRKLDPEYEKKVIGPTEKFLDESQRLQGDIMQSQRAVGSQIGTKLKQLGQQFPRDVSDQNLKRVMQGIIDNLSDQPEEQANIRKLWDTFQKISVQLELVNSNSVALIQQQQALKSAHTLLGSTSAANRNLAPLDDWLTLKGREVEKQRRAGNAYFKPEDFKDISALATEIDAGKNPVSAYLRDQLKPATRELLSQDSTTLPSQLAGELNQILETEWTRQMDHYRMLRELARRELELLNEKLATQINQISANPQTALALQMALLEIQTREEQIARLLTFARHGETADKLRNRIQQHEKNLAGQYTIAKAALGSSHAQLTGIITERSRLIETTATSILFKADRFADVNLSSHTRKLLRQNPYTEARICLNRRLLEDAFPGLIRRASQGVYPELEITLPNHEEHAAAIQRAIQNPALAQADRIWAANAEVTNLIFNQNPNRAFYVEESVPLPWMNPYLVPYGIIMKLESYNEVSKFRVLPENNGTGFKKGDSLELVLPDDWQLPAPNRPAKLEVIDADTNGSIIAIGVKDHGDYTKLPPQPATVVNSRGNTAQVIFQYERKPRWPDAIPTETLQRDREFWTQYADRLIGSDIVQPDTSIPEICQWIRRVYIRRNHAGHDARQRRFLRDYVAQRNFATLRLSVARVYLWRADQLDRRLQPLVPGSPEHQEISSQKQKLISAADFAMRQAFAFGAVHPVSSANLLEFLLNHERINDAREVTLIAYRMDPAENNLSHLQKLLTLSAFRLFTDSKADEADQIVEIIHETDPNHLAKNPGLQNSQRMHRNLINMQYETVATFLTNARQKNQLDIRTLGIFTGILRSHLITAHKENNAQKITALRKMYDTVAPGYVDKDPKLTAVRAMSDLPHLEKKHKQFPNDLTNNINLLLTYHELKRTNDSQRMADRLTALPKEESSDLALKAAIRVYNETTNLPSKELATMKLIEDWESAPAYWLDLGIVRNRLKKTNESISALKQAWELSPARPTKDKPDIRRIIREAKILDNLRQLPDFKAIVEANATKSEGNETTPP